MNDTIFALATAPGRAALAVVRLTGPQIGEALRALKVQPPRPRMASLRSLRDSRGEVIDRAIVLRFLAPRSYTGEDMAELHLHGGESVVGAVVETLTAAGFRMAEPGEITRRAFENGKFELDQAEAIADLIDAQTRAQARQALGQLHGALGRRYESWRATLITALAHLEAAVDFPDEEVPPRIADQASVALKELLADVDGALADQARGQRVREGFKIAIIGAPNSGKSSLFNRLLNRDAAIVAAAPGSTRDIIEAPLTLGAYRTILADMAGLRKSADSIEAEGVRRARRWAESADLRLWVVDGSAGDGHWREAIDLVKPGDQCLLNKADLPAGEDAVAAGRAAQCAGAGVITMSLVGGDAENLRHRLSDRVQNDLAGEDFPPVTRERHRRVLAQARDHLARALVDLSAPELAAESARLAARTLERISGRVGAEDVLDEIFARFCIGK
ncbi:MAG: tRNA uridine-5-carboxymethylaminomethyl(34) synthesis GTPase MnmE [Caulobacteraceae bacterium]